MGSYSAFGFLLALPMFMFFMFMFPCAFALFVFALPVLELAGVADMFALPVFELLDVAQPAQRTVTISKSTKAMVRRIEVPPVCISYHGDQNVQGGSRGASGPVNLIQDGNYIVDRVACHAS